MCVRDDNGSMPVAGKLLCVLHGLMVCIYTFLRDFFFRVGLYCVQLSIIGFNMLDYGINHNRDQFGQY